MADDVPRWISPKEESVFLQLLSGPKYGMQLVVGSQGLIKKRDILALLGRMVFKSNIKATKFAPETDGIGRPMLYELTPLGRRIWLAHQTQAKSIPSTKALHEQRSKKEGT